MAVSQNGWSANDRDLVAKMIVPGTERHFVVRKGDVATIFSHFTGWFHKNIEPIDGGIYDDWGYAERLVRSGTSVSNHASGTAIDINATKHVLGRRNTFEERKMEAIRNQLKKYRGAIRWGGDYVNRADEMHFEINVSAATLRNIVADLTKPTEEKPDPRKFRWNEIKIDATLRGEPVVAPGSFPSSAPSGGYQRGSAFSEAIALIEARLKYLGYNSGAIDGSFALTTRAAVVEFQRASKIKDDGIVGPITWSELFDADAVRKAEVEYFGPAWNGTYLKRGSRGPIVKVYQEMLKAQGLTLVADGYFGPRTHELTWKFQAAKRLEQDGVVGRDTWEAARIK